jgi:DNA-binding transcriptional LysR family regulator
MTRIRSRPSLRQIEAFQAVALSGSVSKAAQRLHVSQPAVSRLVSDFEHSVGFVVFDRSRRFELTPEGRLLYQEVEQSFSGIERIAQRAEEILTFRSGHLRIAASPALGLGLLPQVIKAFREAYSGVAISSQVRASQSVAEWVASGQLDLGYAALPINQGGLVTGEAVITPLMLAEEHLISLGPESELRRGVDQAFRRSDVFVLSSVETTMSAQAAMLVREGLGIALIDPLTALSFTDVDFVLKPFEPAVPYEFALLLPSHAGQSRLAGAFVDCVESFYDRARKRLQDLYTSGEDPLRSVDTRSKPRAPWSSAAQ